MIQTILKSVFGSKHDRDIKRMRPVLERVNSLEPAVSRLTDGDILARTEEYKGRVEGGEALEEILPEAFALCRESARRTVRMRHFDVQILGGIVLHEGKIAEMKTGEGKTLVATLAVYLNALSGKGVHLVTVNDYLAKRDSEWMGPVYRGLGLEVGVIQHDMNGEKRREAYAADVTFGTNNEFGFDYLRDNMVPHPELKVQRGHNYAIVDEVDSILIDESRTPLIISGPAEESTRLYYVINRLIPRLRRERDFELDEKDRVVTMTEEGVHRAESILGIDNLFEPENLQVVHHINQALRSHHLYKRDVDYVVKDGEVIIVDEFTGRMMPGRRWSDGLHQAVEAKENLKIKDENQTLATVTFQNFFRMYDKLAGMTGTADTEAAEFMEIYKLDVVVVPTNRPLIRSDNPDVVYRTLKEKQEAIVEEITDCHERGQPVLVGTISIEKSEVLSDLLRRKGIPHHVLNAKQHEKEADIVAQAGRLGAVTIATNMAGRGTDILLGGNPEFLARMRAPAGDDEAYERELGKARAECERAKETVLSLGGLHILGTERHESRRIDNQLRGRSGRQGDPGSSSFYVSLEDDLMRLFGSDRISSMMEKMKWERGEPIVHPWVTKAIARAQHRVELMHFDRRKRLLEYDDVMNIQRKVVYQLRDMILYGEDLEEYTRDLIVEVIESVVDSDVPEKTRPDQWDLVHLADFAKRIFGLEIPPEAFSGEDMKPENVKEIIIAEAMGRLDARKEEFGDKIFADLIKRVLLRVLDNYWKDHLYSMDSLREGIGWRGMSGTDPIVAYKQEGYSLFEGMIQGVKEESLRWVFHVRPVSAAPRPARRAFPADAARGRGGKPRGKGRGERGRKKGRKGGERASGELVSAAALKIGRNDPCPCGSGRKYKKCCGA